MSFERANDKIEQLAGPARARMGDLTQEERSRADRVAQRDEIRGKQPGEHIQEDARDAKDNFTS
ncbi:general stress protein CsbD [Micromonospora sp. WMMD812]|uniref:general stress protein CsbD n=1 Tax=Micromonospora sp. WMMD812 TaxID=3015152 RepID=UPI00248D24C5|nr:general stress protein CsbD [Micromonospora sp. WMMD812]WBB65116.1 general stress protein CsbD [Micromonospora sp. WMMD812]